MSVSIGDLSEQLADIVHTRSHHVVRVEGRARHASSGVVWSRDGLILTSNYTVEFEEDLQIGLADGSRVSAHLVGRDPGTDLALLRVEGVELSPPQWTLSDRARLGHIILTLARPGRTSRVAMGVISTLSGRWEVLPGIEIDRFIQTDCVTRAGFSGALVIDVSGMPIGLFSAGLLERDHVVLPVSTLQRAVSRILQGDGAPLQVAAAAAAAVVEVDDSSASVELSQLSRALDEEGGGAY